MQGRRWGARSLWRGLGLAAGFGLSSLAWEAAAQDVSPNPPNPKSPPAPARVEDLRDLSIDQLAQIEVSSVSKSPLALADAPAAIYVITHDDIIRSGATSIPEILRLAPNLQVAQTSASNYVITARGFSGNTSDQNFSDKLLVLIDGRSTYTPLYSGVYWDMQNVLPEDIDRIEVISGPGATLWGANAVNGVINIITRKSSETQGGVLDLGAGNLGRTASLQYGGRINDQLTYRLYATDFTDDDTKTSTGAKAHDNWSNPQGGFRLDWTPAPADLVTLQGDAYKGSDAQAGAPNEDIAGRNLLTRWNHAWDDGAALQVQAYYDRTERGSAGGGNFVLDTYDLDVQDSFRLGGWNEIVWGGGLRLDQYKIVGTQTLLFSPISRTLDLSNLFVQDTVSLNATTKLTAGLKLEGDPYSGLAVLPSIRLSWKPVETVLVWAAVSKAIRSPTPFDRDVIEKLGPTVFLTGSPTFQPEQLIAYEIGTRIQPLPRLSFSVSTFYNDYHDLKSIATAPTGFIPLHWANGMEGDTYGLEAWGDYRLTDWWKLTASFNILEENLRFKPGASALLGVAQAGDDPEHQASLRSSMNLPRDITFDADLRYVDALPDPHVPAYVELNSRIGWNVTKRVQLSLSGFNLLHDRHLEFPAPAANAVPRSFFAEVRWRF